MHSFSAKYITPSNLVSFEGMEVEYYDTSKRGQLTPNKCKKCSSKFYYFDINTRYLHNGKPSSLQHFLDRYQSSAESAILIENDSTSILQIYY